jgi:hypothetical protein
LWALIQISWNDHRNSHSPSEPRPTDLVARFGLASAIPELHTCASYAA